MKSWHLVILFQDPLFQFLVCFFIFQICSIVILSSCKTCLHYACLSFPFISTNLLFKIFPRLYNPIYTYVLLSFHFTVNMVLSFFVCSNFCFLHFFMYSLMLFFPWNILRNIREISKGHSRDIPRDFIIQVRHYHCKLISGRYKQRSFIVFIFYEILR